MKTITVEIDEQGDASIDLAGFHGHGCARVLHGLIDGSGKLKVLERKTEFYERSDQRSDQAQQQGGGKC